MIGLLLRPGSQPEVVTVPEWTDEAVLDQLHLTGQPHWRTFDAPNVQGGRMLAAFGDWNSGQVNTYARALLSGVMTAPVRGPVLILRASAEPPLYRSLSSQDCLALAAELVASEYPVPGRGRPIPRRGRHRAGRPAPTRGEPC